MKRRATILLLATLALSCTVFAEQITINLNFNGTALAAGNYLWFNSQMNPPNTITNTEPVTLAVTNSVIHVWNSSNTTELYTLNAPNNTITLEQNTTESTNFSGGQWQTTAWAGSGNPPNFFLDGYSWLIPANLPGSLNIVWTMNVSTSVGDTGYTYQYQGAAAQYLRSTNFAMGSAGVTAVNGQNGYTNAGTPSTYAVNTNVIVGGTGGGSSNFTGSLSATENVTINDPAVPEPASMAMVSLGAALIGLQWAGRRWRRARGSAK